jgi:cobalamin biosynthesis protein CbiD
VRRSGAPVDPVVQEFAAKGKFEETVAALSALCGAPTKLVESVMNDARTESDFALILAKAAGLSWPTAKQICILRRKAFRYSPQSIETARHSFDRLQTATAQRLVRFYNERHSALADFQELAQHIKAHESPMRAS